MSNSHDGKGRKHCQRLLCDCGGDGAQAVESTSHERWHITLGHAGFNSPANQGLGYPSEAAARAAIAKATRGGKS